jgi:hypothetical protein
MLCSPGKTISLLVVLLVILAQQKYAFPVTHHISDSYAKSALLALFAIEQPRYC